LKLIFNHSFRTVATQKEADLMIQMLSKNRINARIEKESFNPSSTFSEGSLSSNFEILINTQDNAKANELVMKESVAYLEHIEPDYYLLSFSSKELLEVLQNRYDWSDIDVLLSEKLLRERGVAFDKQIFESINEKEIETLSKGEKKSRVWIFKGYLLSFLGGIGGALTAYSIMKTKKKLPDGSIVYDYDESTRNHAENMMYISVACLILLALARFIMLKN
jgi:hypothetical protein